MSDSLIDRADVQKSRSESRHAHSALERAGGDLLVRPDYEKPAGAVADLSEDTFIAATPAAFPGARPTCAAPHQLRRTDTP